MSDPRDASQWSADDLISLRALNAPAIVAQVASTPALGTLELDRFDAIVVCGGHGPMFQFRGHLALQRAIASFFAVLRGSPPLVAGRRAATSV